MTKRSPLMSWGDKGEVIRNIQYTAREYGVCKALYIQKGGEDYAQQEQGRGR